MYYIEEVMQVTRQATPNFSEFVAHRGDALLRSAYLLTGDRATAEDLVQSALERVVRRWSHIGDDPEAYVRRTIYNQHVSWWRRRRGAHDIELDELHAHPVSSAHDDHIALTIDLHRALQNLTPRQRAVLVLRYFEDLTEAQAADVLGCSVGTVKSTTSLALRRLRDHCPDLVSPALRPERRAR